MARCAVAIHGGAGASAVDVVEAVVPGFRFHPTDEELVNYYLLRKCGGLPLAAPVIAEADLYKFEPWDLPEKAMGGEKEWNFFSPRGRRYPNRSRTNRATGSWYWKATSADKPKTNNALTVNDKFPFHQAGNFNGGPKLHQILARGPWPNTFRLDRATLGKSIGLVTRQNSWEPYMGRPMEQTVPGTCAIVACIVCVEAVHRHLHGNGTFNCRAALSAPYRLLIACRLDATWIPGEGANVGEVLTKLQQMGGAPATTINAPAPAAPCVLPLRSWQEHRWWDDGGLSPERVAALLDSHGPCIGVLWVCPWYGYFDAGSNDVMVYRGCGRSEDDRELSEKIYGKLNVGSHAVVCIGYRFCGGEEMHVLVRDNHDAAANGPQRWIDVNEFDTIYTLQCGSLDHRSPTCAQQIFL